MRMTIFAKGTRLFLENLGEKDFYYAIVLDPRFALKSGDDLTRLVVVRKP